MQSCSQGRWKFSDASVAACDGLEMTVTSLLSLFQASPDVDEEGFSLRPGDEGDDILLSEEVVAAAVLGLFSCKTIELFG